MKNGRDKKMFFFYIRILGTFLKPINIVFVGKITYLFINYVN